MNHLPIAPEKRFATLVEELLHTPGVTPPAGGPQAKKDFGSAALKTQNKVFAMLVRGQLVVKLPKVRVDVLVASGDGERFEPRHDGKLMKEWLVVAPTSQVEWLALAREALAFVRSKSE